MSELLCRRVLDGSVKAAGDDNLSVEIFLSDNGIPLILYTDWEFSSLRILGARIETSFQSGTSDRWLTAKELPELTGLDLANSYIQNARKALSSLEVPSTLLDALIEAARLLVQVGMQPLEKVRQLEKATDPLDFRTFDLTLWPQLTEGCLPYSEGIEVQMKEINSMYSGRFDIYGPLPDQVMRFRRDKCFTARVNNKTTNLHGYLSDDVHELEAGINVSNNGELVESIWARPVRLPYPGICDQPFRRASELTGAELNSDFRKKTIEAVGGRKGCVHIADLILDLVRYYDQIEK